MNRIESRRSGARRVEADDAVEAGSRPVHGAGQTQEAGVVVQRQDQAVGLEQQLQRVGVGAQMAGFHREVDGALERRLPKMLSPDAISLMKP